MLFHNSVTVNLIVKVIYYEDGQNFFYQRFQISKNHKNTHKINITQRQNKVKRQNISRNKDKRRPTVAQATVVSVTAINKISHVDIVYKLFLFFYLSMSRFTRSTSFHTIPSFRNPLIIFPSPFLYYFHMFLYYLSYDSSVYYV